MNSSIQNWTQKIGWCSIELIFNLKGVAVVDVNKESWVLTSHTTQENYRCTVVFLESTVMAKNSVYVENDDLKSKIEKCAVDCYRKVYWYFQISFNYFIVNMYN